MEVAGRLSSEALESTRRRIIAMAGALFSERSYLGVSMNEIAERIGITKPALYYHFPSKMDLYLEVLDEVVAGLRTVIAAATLEKSRDDRLHRLVRNYLEFGMRERNLLNALVVKLAPDDAELRARISLSRQELVDRAEPFVREAMQGLGSSVRADARRLAEMLVALMDGLLVEYVFLDKPVDSAGVADQVLTVLGLLRAPAPSPASAGAELKPAD
jgi:AcrR family transcriptional regulator